MADRLKEIWSGFSSVTDRRLTGKGVDGILVPHRADYDASDEAFLPENYVGPAERAFTVLRADLAAKEKKFARRQDAKAQMSAEAPHEERSDEKAWGKDDLNVGLWSTAMRVERTGLDYERFMASDAGKKALKRTKKKKRFGLF